jgi:hypothetical protein
LIVEKDSRIASRSPMRFLRRDGPSPLAGGCGSPSFGTCGTFAAIVAGATSTSRPARAETDGRTSHVQVDRPESCRTSRSKKNSGPMVVSNCCSESWSEVSWREADDRVRAYANGLLARGVRKGDAFAILARNALDWALVDFALAHIGAVSIPVYASSSLFGMYVPGH